MNDRFKQIATMATNKCIREATTEAWGWEKAYAEFFLLEMERIIEKSILESGPSLDDWDKGYVNGMRCAILDIKTAFGK